MLDYRIHRRRHSAQICSVISGSLLLAACSGGGGGINSPGAPPPPTTPTPPSPTPTPPATPTPTPPTTEDYASAAAFAMKAGAAYDRGLTGKGVTLAVIDTGIDIDGSEFAGRISADSKAFENKIARCATCAPETVTFSLDDVEGHGTQTASIALAARDGVRIHGVAPEATLLALKINGANLGNVTPTGPIAESPDANIANIAPAIRYAVDKGAFVISMSLNGTATGQTALEQKAAMDFVRQNDRLLVQSVSNFTDENNTAPDSITRALVGTDLANKDWFLFGIRVDANLQAPSGNGLPGDLADRTLAVVATNVQVIDKDGQRITVTGNSFAAPAIAGAAALLKQNWPQLGGRAISRILLDTATDLGAAGIDQIYGAGLLNLEKALTAQVPSLGTTTANGVPLTGSSLSFSSAFGGDAANRVSSALGTVTVLDKYGRDYRADLSGAVSVQALSRRGINLAGILQPGPAPWAPDPLNQSSALQLTTSIDDRPRRTQQTGRFGFRLSSGAWMTGQAGGSIERSTLATGAMLRPLGIATQGTDLMIVQKGWSYAVAAAQSRQRVRTLNTDASYYGLTVTAPAGLTVGLAVNHERGSALGIRGAGALAIAGGTTRLGTLGWRGNFGGIGLTGEAVGAMTEVDSRSPVMQFANPIFSTGFRIQADHPAFGGVATFGMTSPLRVERATLRLTTPTGYDWQNELVISQIKDLRLAPEARELNFELGWSAALSRQSWLRFGLAHAVDAGNISGAHDTAAFFTFTAR